MPLWDKSHSICCCCCCCWRPSPEHLFRTVEPKQSFLYLRSGISSKPWKDSDHREPGRGGRGAHCSKIKNLVQRAENVVYVRKDFECCLLTIFKGQLCKNWFVLSPNYNSAPFYKDWPLCREGVTKNQLKSFSVSFSFICSFFRQSAVQLRYPMLFNVKK